MRTPMLLASLSLLTAAGACVTDPDAGGPVTIAIEQALTGQTTAQGTFSMSGAFVDQGATTEELTFEGPLDQSPVPERFRRTVTGADGSIVFVGTASLAFTSQVAAGVTGAWSVEGGTGRYAGLSGRGELTGPADFGAVPPTATLSFSGRIER